MEDQYQVSIHFTICTMTDNAIDEEPMVMARGMGSSSGNGYRGHGETPIANINYHIYRPFPATNQVLMNYRGTFAGQLETTGTLQVNAFTCRLNSIFDCLSLYTLNSNPDASIADAGDALALRQQPSMRKFWSGIYQYYTVVKSRYHFRIRPSNPAGNVDDEIDIFQHLHGVQRPPLRVGNDPVPWSYRKRFPQTIMKKMLMKPNVTATSTDTHKLSTYTDFYGEWYPGTIKHEVEEDEVSKTWHKMETTPPLGEFVSFVYQRSSASSTSNVLNFVWEISIDYIVQLKELKEEYQFIRPGVNLPALTDAYGGVNHNGTVTFI